MKLSDKGYEKLNKHAYIQSEDPFMFAELEKDGVCELELEPNDFKDCAILTLEEAQVILDAFFVLEQESELTQEEMKVVDKLQKIVINESTKRMELKN